MVLFLTGGKTALWQALLHALLVRASIKQQLDLYLIPFGIGSIE